MSTRNPPRVLALTPEHVARVHREEADPGPRRDLTPLTEADMAMVAGDLLARKPPGPFRVFAYGSLIWNPAFEHVEARRVLVPGWRRAFCLNIIRWRASPAQPGLMLALARGGACVGVAYRMPDDDPEARMLRLLQREISCREDLPWLRWLQVRADGERFPALGFYCAPPDDPDVLHLDLAAQAARLARAVGHAGSCAEYLRNTVEHLEALGIHDRYLWRLQALVAAEIEALHPERAADRPNDR